MHIIFFFILVIMGSLQSIIIGLINDYLTKKGYNVDDFSSIDENWKITVTHISSQEMVKIHYKKFEVQEIVDETDKFKKYIEHKLRKLFHKINGSHSIEPESIVQQIQSQVDMEERWIVINDDKSSKMILPKGIRRETEFSYTSTEKEMMELKKQNPSIKYSKDDIAGIAVLRDSLKIIDMQRDTNDRATNTSQTIGKFITRLNVDHSSRRAGTGNPLISINPDVYVFIVDTGIDKNHPDLNIDAGVSRNFVSSNQSDWGDYHGHGTHVAGIVGAKDNNSGIVGVAPNVKLVAIRVLDANGYGYYSNILSALNYILTWKNNNPTKRVIINMSLGGSINSTFDSGVRNIANNNIPVVVAAGNDGKNASGTSPARVTELLTIGAYNPTNNTEASWSNYGTGVDLQAPGVNIDSTYKGGKYAVLSGTSMASPMVAGAIACLLTKNPSIKTIAQIRSNLIADASSTSVKNYDNTTGQNPNITLTKPQSSAGTTKRSLYVGKY